MLTNSCLSSFSTVSLKDIDSVKLMNRVDLKFAFNINKLPVLLSELNVFYNLLEVSGQKVQSYKSLYYDTSNRVFFMKHHNERVNRNKVRFREYVGSGLTFLEIKLKNNKGKTIKKRIRVDSIPNKLSKKDELFINENVGEKLDLMPHQWINFDRITFVDKLFTERLTMDLNLTFSKESQHDGFDNIVIAEIKQERSGSASPFVRIAKKNHILPFRLSKYCMSTIKLDPLIKQNRFKKKLLLINKIQQE